VILGRVVGHVWAARKDPRLERAKLLVIRPHGFYEPAFETRYLVATDDVDAGVGDDVVVCLGKPARWSAGGENTPVDAAVLGIVERIDFHEEALGVAHAGPGISRPIKVPKVPR
jgi:microcompartment protein CcmK/EutM